jgi:hypothetical protein
MKLKALLTKPGKYLKVQYHSIHRSELYTSSLPGLKPLKLKRLPKVIFLIITFLPDGRQVVSIAALARLLVGSIRGKSRKVNNS